LAITIKDIADKAGVAHSTVSRALHGHPAISPETTARVRQIAETLGYVPSAVARGLKTSRSNALGVIISRIDDPFFSEILQGIEDEAQVAGYSLFVAASQRDFERVQGIVQSMRERRVDGVIVCSGRLSAEHGRQLQQIGIPIIAIDNQALEDHEYSITHDHLYGSCQLTQHLINLGHKKIGYLGNKRSGRTTQERLNGFRKSMELAHYQILPKYIYQGSNGQPEGGIEGANYYIGLQDIPSAIVCYNDMMAIGVLHKFQSSGFHIPEDCSIVGFDNISFSAFTNPPLTTFEQPKYEIGFEAARMMMSLLENGNTQTIEHHPRHRVLRGRLIIRNSTASPRADNL
jgi:LacI family transcriptional regulator/LacI family repressor for deo operon, udp, cdd, tsx, nupC, and nupG